MAPRRTESRQQDVGADFDVAQLQFEPVTSDRFVYTQCFVPLGSATGTDLEGAAQAATRKRSTKGTARGARTTARALVGAGSALAKATEAFGEQFGLLFLDRTRIRPLQAVLGEELLSLSLAPGEEVVIEQKTFSQRETTYEDQNEESTETDLELDSTLSTALEQALSKQLNEGSSTTVGISGSIKPPPIEGVQVSVNPSYSHSVNEASSSSANTSVKNTSQTTQKISSKYRAVHKTTMRISTQQQFTSSSQRTLRNPNAFTPIDLRYYKIYQQLELCQERYGVRIAWAPTVLRPGAEVLARANAAYQVVIEEALDAVSLPTPPTPPPPAQTQVQSSNSETVSNRGLWGGVTGESTSITVHIQPPTGQGWAWDGSIQFIESNLRITIVDQPGDQPNIGVMGAWMETSGAVTVKIHVGWENAGEVAIQAQARFVQSDTAQQQAYEKEYAAYQAQAATLNAQAKAGALSEAQAARAKVLESCDALAETLREVIADDIPSSLRSSVTDLELWRSLFDWDGAGMTLFPGWWGESLPDPESSVDSFVNAVAARLYLPIRPGLEAAASELVAQAVAAQGGAQISSAAIEALIAEVEEFRQAELGGPEELLLGTAGEEGCPQVQDKYICMGTWTELLPTEGTHLEVVQASTDAADDLNQVRVEEDAKMRQAETALLGSERALQGAVEQGVAGAPVSVSVGVGSIERLGGRSERTETTDLSKSPAL
jgi:hypothetical protein